MAAFAEFKADLDASPDPEKAAIVADWLARSDDAEILRFASAVAQTRIRMGDLDGYLAIVEAFLERHPRARPAETLPPYLTILGRYPFHARTISDASLATRYVAWIRERLENGSHPALLETLREFLLAIVGSGDVVSECLRLVEQGRYPEENRDAIRLVHREVIVRSISPIGPPSPEKEALAKRGLIWHPEEKTLRRALVQSLVDQEKFEEAAALGTGWIRGADPDATLLRATMAALSGAGHVPEAIAFFGAHAPGNAHDWEFPALLIDAIALYRKIGRERDALVELEPFFEPPRSGELTRTIAGLFARHGQVDHALHHLRLFVETFGSLTPYSHDRSFLRTAEFESLRGNAEYERLSADPPIPVGIWHPDDDGSGDE